MSTFHCTHCGRAIFHRNALIDTVNLWDLTEYQATCYAIREAIEPEKLIRYDTSLHEGWYCCRFILMRMVVDKFGTGSNLLVYTDSVVEVPEGAQPPLHQQTYGQISLTAQDYHGVIQARQALDQLTVVKYGAIWCPPCRLLDRVIDQLVGAKKLPEVTFFSVDVDEESGLFAQWHAQSIPFLIFYYQGKQLQIVSRQHPTVDGGIIGGLLANQVASLCNTALQQARAGHYTIRH